MSKDEYRIAKMKAEKFCDDLLDIAGRALVSGILKPGDRETLFRGKMAVENGWRDLTRVDQSNFETLGYEAMLQIVRGAFHIGCCAVYPDSHKVFIDRQKSKKGGDTAGKKKTEEAEIWKKPVRERVAELHRKTPRMPGTRITNAIIKTPPPGISLPGYDEIYELVSPVLKALKQRMK